MIFTAANVFRGQLIGHALAEIPLAISARHMGAASNLLQNKQTDADHGKISGKKGNCSNCSLVHGKFLESSSSPSTFSVLSV